MAGVMHQSRRGASAGGRRVWIAALAVVVLIGAAGAALLLRDRGPAGRPSFVVIVIDTLRADHLGAYGHDRPTSPYIDRLAQAGVRFDRFYSTSSWTRPAMATLVTGRYARSVGVYEERFDVLPEDVTTVPERLQQAGYVTLGLTANPNVNAWFRFDQGFDAYEDSRVVFSFMPEDEQHRKARRNTELMTADAVTDGALALLDRHRERLDEAPFYLQVLYVDPHFPYTPPAGHRAAVGATGPHLDYDGEIRFADHEIGRFLAGLEERGLTDNTVLVLTSDHGEGLDDHGDLPLAAYHGDTLYDSVLRIPLVLWHPDLPSGRVVEDVTSLLDLAPTLLELAGVAVDDLPGRSLLPLVRGGRDEGRPAYAFAESDWRYANKLAVHSDSHLYVDNLDCRALQESGAHEGLELTAKERDTLTRVPPVELYETGARAHPSRQANAPAEAETLAARLAEWLERTPGRTPERRAPDDVVTLGDGTVVAPLAGADLEQPDEETLEKLRSLGYLDGP